MKFSYVALDRCGCEVKDFVEAVDQNDALNKIRQMGFFAVSIDQRGENKEPEKAWGLFDWIKPQESWNLPIWDEVQHQEIILITHDKKLVNLLASSKTRPRLVYNE